MTHASPLVLTTYDWVPEMVRGLVRDIRVRWVLEETGRPYQVATTPLNPKAPDHFHDQPFGQVPFLQDGDLHLFESGAIVLHLAKGTPLLPEGTDGALTIQWLIAALNSVEPAVMPWGQARFFGTDPAVTEAAAKPLLQRLTQLQTALDNRNWLLPVGFTAADLMMADILRVPDHGGLLDGLPRLSAYLRRACARPAFQRALDAHMTHWASADRTRAPA